MHTLFSRHVRTVRVIVLLALFSVSSFLTAGTNPYADAVIINGKVITADSDDPEEVSIREAIAIQGGRIMAVGTNEDVQPLMADWTEVIDAKGNSVIPGLIDTHNHIYETTTGFPWVVKSMPELLEIQLRAATVEELSDLVNKAVAARAKQTPEGNWIRLGLRPAGVAVNAFGSEITRESLDRAGPNHPVFVSTLSLIHI